MIKAIASSLLLLTVTTKTPFSKATCEKHFHQNNINALIQGPLQDRKQFRFGIKFLELLTEIAPHEISEFVPWAWKSDEAIDRLEYFWTKLYAGELNETLEITLHRDVENTDPHVVLLGTFYNTAKQPIGFFARTFYFNKSGNAEAWGNGMFFDLSLPRSKSISKHIHRFLDNVIYPIVDVRREGLEADYVGRYIWAKSGFEFDNEMYFSEAKSGKLHTVREIFQRNFKRFLKKHNISEADLVFPSDNNLIPLDISKHLQQPEDYIKIHHKEALKIFIKPMIGFKTLAPVKDFRIGIAFLKDNYEPIHPMSTVGSEVYGVISDDAAPYWYGYIEVEKRRKLNRHRP